MSAIEPRTGHRARRRQGESAGQSSAGHSRREAYRQLRNPLNPVALFSPDQIEEMHQAALSLLETIGMRVLNDEARALYRAGGAEVDEATMMVRMDRAMVEACVARAPSVIDFAPRGETRHFRMGQGHVAFATTGGAPHVSDLERGKRNGSLADFQDLTRLAQSFDVIHLMGPGIVEPLDVDLPFRHLETVSNQLLLSDKVPFIHSRGPGQVEDSLELVRLAMGLSVEEMAGRCCCYTAMNTNSPLQLDIPMAHGIMAFARAGQMVLMTPFTLAGAMAPITIPGALTQAHAEALACVALSQLVRPGAPAVYGCFTSNVDMKSGSPAFGTPEFVKAAFGAGQLARRAGLPYRATNATASNAPDAQAIYEAMMSTWGALMGGANLLYHGAGWLEGGLTISMEKFILDIEMLQMFAELFQPIPFSREELALDDVAQVGPGGHFFAANLTMARYNNAFYSPLVSDWRNYGQWSDDGAKTATERACAIWKRTLADYVPPELSVDRAEALADFVARRKSEGGAQPI